MLGPNYTGYASSSFLCLLDEAWDSSKHILRGKLVTADGAVVANKPIKAYLNDTQIETGLKTDQYGCFTFERNFNPTDQKVTYTVQVAFEGTGSLSATLNATALDGTRYTVCRTTQFNYKPSVNMTTVVVEPQATQVTAQVKTREQMQQEAGQEGILRTWTDFSWWYPWLRLHVEIKVNPTLHVALNPLLVGGEIVDWSNDVIDLFKGLIEEYLIEMIIEVGALLGLYLVAKGLSIMGRVGQPWLLALALVAFASKCAIQTYLFARSWSDKMGMLASALVSTVLGLFALAKIDVVLGFIEKVARVVSKNVALALSQLVDKLLSVFNAAGATFSFCRDLIDYLELTADFCFAGASWVRYITLCSGVS